MAKKKQVLTIDFDYDFYLLGLVSHLKDYRLCYELNRILEIDLIKSASLDLKNKQQDSSEFALYFCEIHEEKEICVVANKSKGGTLVPEQYQIDYFIMLKGGFRLDEKEIIKQKIKSGAGILGVYEIDPSKLKSKENLLF